MWAARAFRILPVMKKTRALSIAVLTVLCVIAVAGNFSCASTRCATVGSELGSAKASQLESDGSCLSAYEWPAKGEPRGVLVIMHGIRDHALRYSALADAANAAGFAVFAADMRGHGHSGGARQRFESLDQLVGDLRVVVESAQKRYPGNPVFLYGHSLGGLIATRYAEQYQAELSGLVLSGPALKLLPTVTSGQMSAARFFGTVLPGLPAQPVDDNDFVSAPQEREALQHDPFVWHDNLPARSAKAGLNGVDDVQQHGAELTLPLLMMHGTVDKATNIEGSQWLNATAKSSDKTLKLWEGSYHDLLHEPQRDQVISTVVAWLTAHLPPQGP
jgi:alpha-beta hydrolase superfamily lysophospholipase